MTLLVTLSFPSFRRSDFELFYAVHILLVPLTLVFSSLHYPPLGPWCWAALALWGLERTWRLVKNIWINGNFFQEKVPINYQPQAFAIIPEHRPNFDPYGHRGLLSTNSTSNDLKSPYSAKGNREQYEPVDSAATADSSSRFVFPPTPHQTSFDPNDLTSIIPPGCGRAELLPGRTIRLIVRPRRRLAYNAGQYAFLAFPILSRFTGHPFTIVSARDAPTPGDIESGVRSELTLGSSNAPQFLEFIIRARQGLTLDLWNHLQRTRTHDPQTGKHIPTILRVRVDGSYGSAVRVKWTTYASALIVVGGSGVAFGLSLLGHLCQSMRDADKRFRDGGIRSDDEQRSNKARASVVNLGLLGGKAKTEQVLTTRVRFVWLVREYCE